jgi:choline dehydrogenase-like flavoprotein
MTNTHDALISGAGQAGPPLAGRLTAAGMSVGLVERKLFGGARVNTAASASNCPQPLRGRVAGTKERPGKRGRKLIDR